MRTNRALVVFALLAGGCAVAEPKDPDSEGVVVLDVATPSATTAPSKPAAPVVAAGTSELDIESCIALVRSDPFPTGPSDPRGGEIHAAGLAAEKRGDFESARKLYFDLIQRFSGSSYISLGYLAFGELFRAEALRDPTKIEFAKQSYQEVIKYPAPGNPAWEIAILRRAELSAMAGEGTDVLAMLSKLGQAPGGRCAEPLARARAAMLPPAYASSGQPEKAASFFARIGSGEAPAKLTLHLAELYMTQQKRAEAIATLQGLAGTSFNASATTCSELVSLAKDLAVPKIAAELSGRCKP